MSKKIIYKKLDEDDILEIILEYFQDSLNNSEYSRGVLLGNAGENLRFIGVFGNEGDKKIKNCDLLKIDEENDFNGDHQFLKNNSDFLIE